MTAVNEEYSIKKSAILNRLPLLLAFVGLAILGGWFFYHAVPVWKSTNSLLDLREDAEVLIADGLVNIDPEEAEEMVKQVHTDIKTLNYHLEPLLPAVTKLDWLPKIGPLLAAAPELMTMADAGADTALDAFTGLKPALYVLQDEDIEGREKIAAVSTILGYAEPELIRATGSFDKVIDARNSVQDIEDLPWRIRTLLERFDQELPFAGAMFKLAPIIPGIAGSDRLKNYLIIVQNEDELRATGGYISGAGLLTIEDGTILSLTFDDAYKIDNWKNKPYDSPPAAIQEFMTSELFLFRDANFWPDFPTSAERAMQLYTYGTNVSLDGAIAVDQNFLRILLEAVGPVYVAELDRQISSENFVDQIRAEWEPEDEEDFTWLGSRKDFMAPLANSLITKLLEDFETLDIHLLANSLLEAAEERHLQIYLSNHDFAAIIDELTWDGKQLLEESTDYLQVVDTNMGFNKVNAVIERSIDYNIDLYQNGSAAAALEVSYTNRGAAVEDCTPGGASYAADQISYDGLVNDCYWNYLRIYPAPGSELISASEHPISGELLLSKISWNGSARVESEASGRVKYFANFLLVSPQEAQSVFFNYKLPAETLEKTQDGLEYHLIVQKQPGTFEDPLRIRIRLPAELALVEANPLPTHVEGKDLIFETTLWKDQQVKLLLRESLGG